MSDLSCEKVTNQYNDVADIDESSIYPVKHRVFHMSYNSRMGILARELTEEEINKVFGKEIPSYGQNKVQETV